VRSIGLLLSCFIVALGISAQASQPESNPVEHWRGTPDAYRSIQCGANDGSCPKTGCNAPDTHGCRLFWSQWPFFSPKKGLFPFEFDHVLRVKVAQGDAGTGKWGRDNRNEYVGPQYGETDHDLYYAWSVNLPGYYDWYNLISGYFNRPELARQMSYSIPNSSLPDPPPLIFDGGPEWNIIDNKAGGLFFQFHSISPCGAGGPNLGVGLVRTDVNCELGVRPCGLEKGNDYQIALVAKDDFSMGPGRRLWPPYGVDEKTGKIIYSTKPVSRGWHTFVLRVRWSDKAEFGFVQFYMDGQLAFEQRRATLYTWRDPEDRTDSVYWIDKDTPRDCKKYEVNPVPIGQPMPVELKLGYYRSALYKWPDLLMIRAPRVGTSYEEVVPK